MKTFLTLATLVLSLNSFAGVKYICSETSGETSMKMILTQIGNQELEEGEPYRFKLEIYNKFNNRPLYADYVTVRTEDVIFGFQDRLNRVSGVIYLDEMDRAYLKVNGNDYEFDCQ